jgi:hypothetical protein
MGTPIFMNEKFPELVFSLLGSVQQSIWLAEIAYKKICQGN